MFISPYTVVTMSDMFDDYPEPRPADTTVEMVTGLAGSASPDVGVLARLIQTSHFRRLATLHRRTASRLRVLEDASDFSLFHRALDGDEYVRELILSTCATITRLLQEAVDEEKRQAFAVGLASSLMCPVGAEDVERRYFCCPPISSIGLACLLITARSLPPVPWLRIARAPIRSPFGSVPCLRVSSLLSGPALGVPGFLSVLRQ